MKRHERLDDYPYVSKDDFIQAFWAIVAIFLFALVLFGMTAVES